jgi:hypothetical protein
MSRLIVYALEYLQLIQYYDGILVIHCSRHLSETYNVAVRVYEDQVWRLALNRCLSLMKAAWR